MSPSFYPYVQANYILQLNKFDDFKYSVEEKYILSSMGEPTIAHDVISYNFDNKIYTLTITGSRNSIDKQILAYQFSDIFSVTK